MAYSPKNANGQATMANSEPVVIASDQSAVPVSGTITANIGTVATLATAAKQDTGNTSLGTIAGAVSGTEMQVDVLTMPSTAVTNAGLTALNGAISGTEVQVDVLTMPTVTVNAHAVTNAGTFVVQENGAALTSLQLIDDTVFTDDTSTHATGTTKGIGIMAVAAPTDTALNANDIGMPGMTANRELYTSVTTALPAGTNAIGKLAANSGVDIGDVDVTSVPADPFGVNADAASATGSISAKLRFIANTGIPITGTVTVGSHAVTNAGTFVTQENGALLTAAQLIDDTIFADDAAVTLGTSKGSILAGVAVQTDGTDPASVSAEGDAAALRTDMNRLLIVNQTHPRFWHVSADYASAQTNTSVKAAPGASLSLYITDIQVSNGATAGNVTLLDGSGGTVLYELYPGINGGAVLSLRSPIKLTANTALCITSTSVTTHSIFVSGYISA